MSDNISEWLRDLAREYRDFDIATILEEKADELDKQNGTNDEMEKEYFAQWPKYKNCLIDDVSGKGIPETMTNDLLEGYPLWTGVHNLNMIPHTITDICPVDNPEEQYVVVWCRGSYILPRISLASNFSWNISGYDTDITHYCPVKMIKVEE